jgi:hypothetical protein
MDTYNKVMEGNVGMEEGRTPGGLLPARRPRGGSGSGSDVDLTDFALVEQQRLQHQRTNDGERNQIEAAGRLATINPLNPEEENIRSEGIRFLASLLRPPLPPRTDTPRERRRS